MYNIKFAILSGSEWHWVLSHWGTTITAIRSWNFFIFPNSKFFPRHSNSLFPALINSVLLAACLDWATPPLPGIMPLPFVLDVFCSVQCLQGSPRLQQASEFPSFLRLINTPVCGWATFCLPIHPSVDTGVVSTFRLLWLKMLHSVCQQTWNTQQRPQDWKGQFSFQFQRRIMPKNFKSFKLGFSSI